jgi:hypothetical protein
MQAGTRSIGVAAALGGAFLLYRAFMQRKLRERHKDAVETSPEELIRSARQVYGVFLPHWLAMTIPAITTGLLNGARETDFLLTPEVQAAMAEQYARGLGDHLNEVSADAIARGYSMLVNRKIPAKIALANMIDAFGAPSRAVRTAVVLISGKEDARLSDILLPSMKKMRVRRVIEAAVNERAEMIGETESWTMKEQGKQVAWLYAVRQGLLPATATRQWITADDERVCPVCGPMHGTEIPVGEKFVVSDYEVWSPPVHPNCRCFVEVRHHLLAKSENDWETQPRQKSGRFGSRPHQYAEPEIDLQRAVQNAELAEVQVRQTLQSRPRGLLKQRPQGRLKQRPLNSGGINRKGIDRGGIKRGGIKRGQINRDKLNRELRLAQAKMEGRISARLSDITPDDPMPQPDPKVYHEGLVATDEPMYAIVDGRMEHRNGVFHLDQTDVTADKDFLWTRVQEMNQEADRDYLEMIYESNEETFELSDGRRGILDEYSFAQAVTWARTFQSKEWVGEDFVDVPVMGYIDIEGNVIDERSPEWDADSVDHAEMEGFIQMEEIDVVSVPASEIVEKYDLHQHVADSTPHLIRLNVVPENDVDYDANGLPFANPTGRYASAGMSNVYLHNGESYLAYDLEPDWMTDNDGMRLL